jgi:hypothetical protein
MVRHDSAANTHPSPPPSGQEEEEATTAPDTPRRQAGVTPPLPRSQPTHDSERSEGTSNTWEEIYNSISEDSYNSMQADDSIMPEMTPGCGMPKAARTNVSQPRHRIVSNLVAPMRGRGGSFTRLSLDRLCGVSGGGGGRGRVRPDSIHVTRQAPSQGAAKSQGGAPKPVPPGLSHSNTQENKHAPQGATASSKGSRMSTHSYATSYATSHQGRTQRGAKPHSQPESKAGTYDTSGESGVEGRKRKAATPRLSTRAAEAAAETVAAISTWL